MHFINNSVLICKTSNYTTLKKRKVELVLSDAHLGTYGSMPEELTTSFFDKT
jgi:hypothetical protein